MQQLQIHVAGDKCVLSREGTGGYLLPTAASSKPARFIKLAGFSLVARVLENEMPNGSVSWNLKLINFQSWKAPWRTSGSTPSHFFF